MRISLSPKGPKFSRIVFGCMNWGAWGSRLDTKSQLRLIEESIDIGVTTFDHADIYGHYTTEAEFGAALKKQPNLRGRIELVTKCGIQLVTPNRPQHQIKSYNLRKRYIIESVEHSLRNLNTDYLDLLLIHRPSPLMNGGEIAEAFTYLHQTGKVRAFGVSNFSPSEFELLNTYYPLVTNQVEASLLHQNPIFDGTFHQCQRLGISPMAWSPLSGGKLFASTATPTVQRLRLLAEEAQDTLGLTLDQLALAWLLHLPVNVLPVLGTTKINRVKAAVKVVNTKLDDEWWFKVMEAVTGEEVA